MWDGNKWIPIRHLVNKASSESHSSSNTQFILIYLHCDETERSSLKMKRLGRRHMIKKGDFFQVCENRTSLDNKPELTQISHDVWDDIEIAVCSHLAGIDVVKTRVRVCVLSHCKIKDNLQPWLLKTDPTLMSQKISDICLIWQTLQPPNGDRRAFQIKCLFQI